MGFIHRYLNQWMPIESSFDAEITIFTHSWVEDLIKKPKLFEELALHHHTPKS